MQNRAKSSNFSNLFSKEHFYNEKQLYNDESKFNHIANLFIVVVPGTHWKDIEEEI